MQLSEGLVGSLIGAGAALIGTWLTLWHSRKAQREQWHLEQTYKNFEALRDAYVEWIDAVSRVGGEAAMLKAAIDNGHIQSVHEALERTRADVPFQATKITLMEPDAEAHQRVRTAISTYYDSMQIMFAETSTKEQRSRNLRRIAVAFDEVSEWLSARFSRVPTEFSKSSAPSGSRTLQAQRQVTPPPPTET